MINMFMLILLTLSLALLSLNYFISVKPLVNREKSSIFECGFDPSTFSRMPFSMHFFLVALIFLIFDVEISLLAPIPLLSSHVSGQAIIGLSLSVLALLLVGALLEWAEGSLEWGI